MPASRAVLLAAAAVMFAYWGDMHVFFFSILLLPFWTVLVLLYGGLSGNLVRWRKAINRPGALGGERVGLCRTGLPAEKSHRHSHGLRRWAQFQGSVDYSPFEQDLFRQSGYGIYLGYVLPGLLLLGLLSQLYLYVRDTVPSGARLRSLSCSWFDGGCRRAGLGHARSA